MVLAEYEAVNRTLSSFLVLQFYSDRKKKVLFLVINLFGLTVNALKLPGKIDCLADASH